MRNVVARSGSLALAGVVALVIHSIVPSNIAWDLGTVVVSSAVYGLAHQFVIQEDGTGDNPQMP